MRNRPSAHLGFTLIEVLIAMTILATLGLLTGQAISQGVKSKKKIQEQIDDVSKLRDAVKLIERDIQLAFHYQDLELEMQELLKKKTAAKPVDNKTPFPPPNPIPGSEPKTDPTREMPRQDPVTHLIGFENSIHFVTMNVGRMNRDAEQADYMEVGYALKDCKSTDGKSSSKCIWRQTSALVDEDPTTNDGEEMVLLENVSEFTLKYIGTGKQDWLNTWNTKTSPDALVKDKFPLAIEVSVTIEKKVQGRGAKAKKYSMQIVAPIHFPNNKGEETAAAIPETSANTNVKKGIGGTGK